MHINSLGSGFALVVTSLFLLGCAEGPYTPGEATAVVIDGENLRVAKGGEMWVSWWHTEGLVGIMPPLAKLKPLQIQAIEQISECKVLSAEYVPNSIMAAHLIATVKC